MISNEQASHLLNELATLLEITGENPFKVNAYRNAARVIESLNEDITDLVSSGNITKTKGIGKGISDKLSELTTTGHLKYYDELKEKTPQGLVEMLKIRGLGPKKIKQIYKKLGISTVGELEYACIENRLADLPGFGIKTQEKVLKGIKEVKKYVGKYLYPEAFENAHKILECFSGLDFVHQLSLAGSIRRKREVVKDIDVLIAIPENEPLATRETATDIFVTMPFVESVEARGETKSTIRLSSGITSDLRIITSRQYPFALHYFTGSKAHNVAMRHYAKKLHMKLNEYGLFLKEAVVDCGTEEELFTSLGMDYIVPELREGMGEIEAALAHNLPNLVQPDDIKGIFHIHTAYSDGMTDIGTYAEHAAKQGYEYIGISDHSQSAYYAGGLTVDQIRAQHKEIDAINRSRNDIFIFKGIEVDILSDGVLDYDNEVLKTFDFVIAAIHDHFTQPKSQMTRRIVKALENKYVTMFAHPTGRLLLSREPYEVDMDEVITAASKNGIIMELNANPYRLDVDWRTCRKLKKKGLKVSINPDAHNPPGLSDLNLGVGIARKGWLEKVDVFNTQNLEDIKALLRVHHI